MTELPAPHSRRVSSFENTPLWDSALKLKRSIEGTSCENQLYFEAVGTVLMHELVNLERGASPKNESYVRGGLAMHHQRMAAAYIEEHLQEQISLSTLADLTKLSPFHFCRAFKTSFGVPPHRYHTGRRIEHAKGLLAKRDLSITEIGLIQRNQLVLLSLSEGDGRCSPGLSNEPELSYRSGDLEP